MFQLSSQKISTLEIDGNTGRVEQYLKTLHESDPSFDFQIARNGENGATRASLWQTGTMRADFDLYGCALNVNFMKHKMNSFE